jgi:hypothetical protein
MPVLGIEIVLEHEKKAHSVAKPRQNAQKKPWVSMNGRKQRVGKIHVAISKI